jgi:hypothetical protein
VFLPAAATGIAHDAADDEEEFLDTRSDQQANLENLTSAEQKEAAMGADRRTAIPD